MWNILYKALSFISLLSKMKIITENTTHLNSFYSDENELLISPLFIGVFSLTIHIRCNICIFICLYTGLRTPHSNNFRVAFAAFLPKKYICLAIGWHIFFLSYLIERSLSLSVKCNSSVQDLHTDYVPVLFSLNIDFESSTKSFFKRYCNPAETLTLISISLF